MAYDRDKSNFKNKRAESKNKRPPRQTSEAAVQSDSYVFGRNAVKELLDSGRDIEKIYVRRGDREGSINLLIGIATERRIPLVEVDRQKLDGMIGGSSHQGIVAVASEHSYANIDEIFEYAESLGQKPTVLILDGVEDPHNLGAIIRSADCLGVHGIIIPKRRSVGLNATVAKVSAGAIEHVRVAKVTNLAQTMDELKERGMWLYAADMDGEAVYSTDMKGSVGVVLGSEGFGISRLVKEKCDFHISIPMYGKVNSFNVSCATAVILSKAARDRHAKK